MTSSLVGSEMCIRDRDITHNPQRLAAKHTVTTDKIHGAQQHRDSQETVSYTHLTLPTICSV
eukprot:5295702-Prorocentrum_lima.AAC.1